MQMSVSPTSGLDSGAAGLLRSWAALPQGPRDQLALPPFVAFPPAMTGSRRGEGQFSLVGLTYLRKGRLSEHAPSQMLAPPSENFFILLSSFITC